MPSLPQPSKVQTLETRAFLLTVSVKGDLSSECSDSIVKWAQKNTEMSYVVAEHGDSGKRHLHAVLLFKEPRSSKKLHENLWDRQVKPHHPDSIGKHAVKVQVCPGNKWYLEYLQKETDREVLQDNYVPADAESYFPTQAVQEALVATGKRKGMACPWLEEDVQTWATTTYENSTIGALMYLKHRMFVAKNMVPLADKRKLTDKAVMYWEYRNGNISPSPKELCLLHQAEMVDQYVGPSVIHDPLFSSAPRI